MSTDTAVHHRWADIPFELLTPSIARRFITTSRFTVAQFELKRGAVIPRHAHDQEQVTCVLRGTLKFAINGRDIVVREGEALQIPSWLEHEIEVLDDAFVIDVFSPVRQDWIDKTDDYFRR